MPILPSAYRAPWPLHNAHLATIWPSLFRALPAMPDFMRLSVVRLDTPDGDFLDLDLYRRADGRARGLIVLSHGLEGNSRRAYILGLARELALRGFDILAWNMRSCSGEDNRTRRLYHMGDTLDLDTVVCHAASLGLPVGLAGFSLGGNQICRYLAAPGLPPQVRGAAVISVPCDLPGAAVVMDGPACRIYMAYFLRTLRRKVRAKAARFADYPPVDGVERIHSFSVFDERFTAPVHGFASARDYWERSSALPVLAAIRTPLYMLLSADDPFCSPSCYPRREAAENPAFFLEVADHGGHVGFARRGACYYSEERAADFLDGLFDTRNS